TRDAVEPRTNVVTDHREAPGASDADRRTSRSPDGHVDELRIRLSARDLILEPRPAIGPGAVTRQTRSPGTHLQHQPDIDGVNAQLPRRAARLREVLDLDDAADAHVDGREVVEVDHASPMTFMRRDKAVIANARVSFIVTPKGVGSSSAMPSIHLGLSTPSAAGPTSMSVRWIASLYFASRCAISR